MAALNSHEARNYANANLTTLISIAGMSWRIHAWRAVANCCAMTQ
jgi:hypothetical protein